MLKKDGMTTAEIAEVMPDYNSFKSSMYRAKNLAFPMLPKTLDDLDFWADVARVFNN